MFFEGQYSLIMPYTPSGSYIIKKDYVFDGYVNEVQKNSNKGLQKTAENRKIEELESEIEELK